MYGPVERRASGTAAPGIPASSERDQETGPCMQQNLVAVLEGE